MIRQRRIHRIESSRIRASTFLSVCISTYCWMCVLLQPMPPPTEIVQAVIHGGTPPLRPSLCFHSHSEELGVLMQRCWSEEPSERPDFNTIKILLRKQHRWARGNGPAFVLRQVFMMLWLMLKQETCKKSPSMLSAVQNFYSALCLDTKQSWQRASPVTL